MGNLLRVGGAAAALALALAFGVQGASAGSCIGSCGNNMGPDGDVTAPPISSTYSWISTYGGVDGAGQLPGIGGTDGSSLTSSSFTAAAGDNLRYYFNFVSSDGQSVPGSFIYEDYGWVQLVNLATNATTMLFNGRAEPIGLTVPGQGLPPIDPAVTLTPASSGMNTGTGAGGGPVWSPLGDPALGGYSGACWGPGCGFSGWIQSDYTVPTDGAYELVFGVTNWGDTIYDTGVAFAGLTINNEPIDDTVPEPSTWAMLLLGFAGLAAAARRRAVKLA
jgi:hypothetical protein